MRCGNCLNPEHEHRKRMSAPPLCPDGKGIYREGTEEELSAAYDKAFPDGPPGPIASFDLNNPDDVERAKAALNPVSLNRFFGGGRRDMAGFEAALKGEASE